MNEAVLKISGLRRVYQTRVGPLEVLKDVDLVVHKGEIVGLIGPSGSGKSSLLHSAGLLEEIQGGAITIDGEELAGLNDDARTNIRLKRLGFVYQFHNLLPEFTARENIALPLLVAGQSRVDALQRADELLGQLGLLERADHTPAQLSGGEQQRVAIGRALANRPKLLLADEPTGNLDPKTSQSVFELLAKLAKEEGVAVLVGTHNLELAGKMDRVVRLENGDLVPA
jgi:lipoprotein-releasing system ATP-binding protein